MSYAQQKVRVEIPYGFTPSQREEIGKAIVDFIRMRTKSDNIDKNNKGFAEYSPEYEAKKGTSRVNLTETGDMLENLKVLRTYTNYITIGYERDYDGMGKVEGIRKGTFGNAKPVTEKRDFIGITQGDLNAILAQLDYTPNERFGRNQEALLESARQLTPQQREDLQRQRFLQRAGINNNFI